MRIAIFTETYLPDINGVATHIKTLRDGLEAMGNQVLIVKADHSCRRHKINEGILSCPALMSKKMYNFSISYPISIKRFKYIKAWNPDIIHIHNEFPIGFSGMLIAKALKKPLVYTLHTMYDDYIYYIAKKPFIPLVTRLSHRYLRLIANNASAVTGASRKVEAFFKECGYEKKINIIPNAVELDIFGANVLNYNKVQKIRNDYKINNGIKAACFCGRLGNEKNLDMLLNLWAAVHEDNPQWRLIIIGDGPVRPYLVSLCHALGISECVAFTGKIPHDELQPYYCSCNAYITASMSENYSISMLEAMANGLPIIHLRDNVNEEQFIDRLNGFAFDNEYELSQILGHLGALPKEKAEQLSTDIRKTVSGSGSTNLAQSLMPVYSEII